MYITQKQNKTKFARANISGKKKNQEPVLEGANVL